jgi:hypothetical protein
VLGSIRFRSSGKDEGDRRVGTLWPSFPPFEELVEIVPKDALWAGPPLALHLIEGTLLHPKRLRLAVWRAPWRAQIDLTSLFERQFGPCLNIGSYAPIQLL